MPTKTKRKRPGQDRSVKTPGEDLLPQHEAFARGVADGLSAAESYRRHVATEKILTTTAWCNGSQLLAKVKHRVEELRKKTKEVMSEKFGITRETIIAMHAEIMETPIGEIHRDHRLAQEVRDTEDSTTIKMPSKMDSLREITKMAGWYATEKVELGLSADFCDVLADIRARRGERDVTPEKPAIEAGKAPTTPP